MLNLIQRLSKISPFNIGFFVKTAQFMLEKSCYVLIRFSLLLVKKRDQIHILTIHRAYFNNYPAKSHYGVIEESSKEI